MARSSESTGVSSQDRDESGSVEEIPSAQAIIEEAWNDRISEYDILVTKKIDAVAKRATKNVETRLTTEFNKTIENEIKKVNKDFEDSLKDSHKELEDVKTNTIQALGIFAALFTFISVDIQIFRQAVSIITASGLILVMLGALLIFVLVLVFFTNHSNLKGFPFYFSFVIALGLIGGGAYFVGAGNEESFGDYYTKSEIQDLTNQKILDLKQCILKKSLYQCIQ